MRIFNMGGEGDYFLLYLPTVYFFFFLSSSPCPDLGGVLVFGGFGLVVNSETCVKINHE